MQPALINFQFAVAEVEVVILSWHGGYCYNGIS